MNKRFLRFFFLTEASPASLFLVGNLFLFQPALLYANNISFIYTSFFSILIFLLPVALIFYILLSLPANIKFAFFKKYYPIFLTAVACTLWAATFFNGTVGSLDGKSFGFITDKIILKINLLVLFGVFLLSMGLTKYYQKIMNYFLVSLSVTYALYVTFILFNTSVTTTAVPQHSKNLKMDLTTFSPKKNVLLILLDTFQSDLFQEIIQKNPEWISELTGFTYYPYAVGAARTTFMSIPTIHSGQIYQADKSVTQFYHDTVLEHSFVTAHTHQGYRGLVFNNYLQRCPANTICGTEAELYYGRFAPLKRAILLLNLSLLKSMPNYFKPWIYHDGEWRLNIISQPMQVLSNNALTVLASYINTTSTQPTIKFIHLFSTHPAAILDATCKQLPALTWDRDSAINQDTCVFSKVLKVLQTLKKQNIYDQTAIMIIADHGAGLVAPQVNMLNGYANPLFLYKPFKAKQSFQTSAKLVGLMDIPATLCGASHDCGKMIFDGFDIAIAPLNKMRHFRFNDYQWSNAYFDPNKIYPVIPYEITENVKHVLFWKKNLANSILIKNIPFGSWIFQGYANTGWEVGQAVSQLWTFGKTADLFLPLVIHHEVTLQFSASTHSENQHQFISIWVNQFFIGRYPIQVDKKNHIAFTIPAKVIQTTKTHIIFKFDQDNRPKTIDYRPLAVSFFGDLTIS